MAKKIYTGVSNKARAVKKAYIGVNGKARKIKKAYIGVNGIARQIYRADLNLLPEFSASDYYNLNGAFQRARINTNGSIQFNATSSLCRNIWTPAVNLDEWETLTITYTVTTSTKNAGYNDGRRFFIMANSTNNFTWIGDRSDQVEGDPKTTYYAMYRSGTNTVTAGTTYTQTVDISSWSGTQKIGLCALCTSNNTLTMSVSSVVLS